MTRHNFDSEAEESEYRWRKWEKKILDEYYGEEWKDNKNGDEDNG